MGELQSLCNILHADLISSKMFGFYKPNDETGNAHENRRKLTHSLTLSLSVVEGGVVGMWGQL